MGTTWQRTLGFVASAWMIGCGPSAQAGGTETDSEGETEDTTGSADTTPVTTMNADADADADATEGADADADGTADAADVDADADADATADADGTADTGGSGDTGGGENTNCCATHDSPGCNEPDVETCVCEGDANCCVFSWDDVCAEAAMNDCMAMCIDDGGTGGTTDSGMGMACGDVVEIEIGADMATLTGDFELVMSSQGEGMVASVGFPMMGDPEPMGTVAWSVDIPCEDTWHVWVRWFENSATDDSFFCQVDGDPDPSAIFEGDCVGFPGGGGMGWSWSELNWRDPMAGPCEYVQDPWTFDWSGGSHDLVFEYRESIAIARIVVTNDPMYDPNA